MRLWDIEGYTLSDWRELTPEHPDGSGVIKNIVCGYCGNKFKHGCIVVCAPEGLYRNLEPMALGNWQRLPKLPAMSKLMRYAPVTRIAFMYLVLHYAFSVDDWINLVDIRSPSGWINGGER